MLPIIDAQGFEINGCFYIRELAFIYKEFKLCLEVNPGISLNDITSRDRITIAWCREYHGLDFIPKNDCISYDVCIALLRHLFHKYEKPFIVQNNQLQSLLENIGVKTLNPKLPSQKVLRNYYPQIKCQHHDDSKACAYRKVHNIRSWIHEEKLVSNIIANSI